MLTSILLRYTPVYNKSTNLNIDPVGYGFKSTNNQDKYIESLNNKRIIVAHGPAGTGKTMLACSHAIQELNNRTYDKVLITRPAVTVDEEHGYLPGDMNQKMHPWMIPIYDNFNLFTVKSNLDYLIDTGKLEIAPLSFIRGRTFHNSLIIADEMQNSTCNQMKTLLTRIGMNSALIITGDLDQCDLEIVEQNGLLDFITKFDKFQTQHNVYEDEYIDIIKLDESDIQRSDAVKHVLNIYDDVN